MRVFRFGCWRQVSCHALTGAVIVALQLAWTVPAGATSIHAVSGAVNEVSRWLVIANGSLEEGAYTKDDEIRVFEERLNAQLLAPLNVDITTLGTYGLPVSPGVIPANEWITCFMFHVDRTTPGGMSDVAGTIEFSQDILGIIVQDATLDGSDGALGLAGITYPTGVAWRGLELNGMDADQIQLLDHRRIALDLHTMEHLDQIRVILESDGNGVTFSIDYQGPSDVLAPSFGPAGVAQIGSGNILTVGTGGGPGPNPPAAAPVAVPGVVVTIQRLGIPNAGAGGVYELDALSFGDDAGSRIRFSVDEFAKGMSGTAAPPDVYSEGSLHNQEASADLFVYLGPLEVTDPALIFGNRASNDGDAVAPTGLAGFGLLEPNAPGMGLPDPGDNLDAIDQGTTLSDLAGPIFYSLDGSFADAAEGAVGPPNTGTGLANGYSGADVLVVSAPGPAAVEQVYAGFAALGLAQGDDIDALLVINDNADDLGGDNGITYDIGLDVILFSLRRGSPSLGTICPRTGLAITEADILEPGPMIVIAGESLGLFTDRTAPPVTLSDDLDALDAFMPREYPAAENDLGNVGQGQQIMNDVLANDIAPYGAIDPSTVVIFRAPEHGSIVSINPVTGAITYQHDGLGSAADSYQYVVFDTAGMVSDVTTVRLRIDSPSSVSNGSRNALQFFRFSGTNPSAANTLLSFAVSKEGPARVDIFDAAGRHVRRLFDAHVLAGEAHQVSWDGKNASGRPVQAGVFYGRVSSASGSQELRFVRVR